MKKPFYLVLMLSLFITACTKKTPDKPELDPNLFEFESFDQFVDFWNLSPYLDVCPSVTDSFEWPDGTKTVDPITIPDEIALSMSACGLLQTLFTHPKILLGPWPRNPSFGLPGVTIFNDNLKASNVAVELLKRDDCFPVFASKYLNTIQRKAEQIQHISYLEMLFASDLAMSAFNEKEKTLLMAMAYERIKQSKLNPELIHIEATCHILVVTMRSCNYAPFLSKFGTYWIDSAYGYDICYLFQDAIIKETKRFLHEKIKLYFCI